MGSVFDFNQPFVVQTDLRKTGRVSHSGFQWTFYILTPQVCGKEGLGGHIAIDEDRVIMDRTGQDIGDRTEDKGRILS